MGWTPTGQDQTSMRTAPYPNTLLTENLLECPSLSTYSLPTHRDSYTESGQLYKTHKYLSLLRNRFRTENHHTLILFLISWRDLESGEQTISPFYSPGRGTVIVLLVYSITRTYKRKFKVRQSTTESLTVPLRPEVSSITVYQLCTLGSQKMIL